VISESKYDKLPGQISGGERIQNFREGGFPPGYMPRINTDRRPSNKHVC